MKACVGEKVVVVKGHPEDIGFEGYIIEIGRDGTTAYVQMPGAQCGQWFSMTALIEVSEHSEEVVKTFDDTALDFEIDTLTRTIEFVEETLKSDKARLEMLKQERLDRIGYCLKCGHSWTYLIENKVPDSWIPVGTIYCGKGEGFGNWCDCRNFEDAPEHILDKFKVY